ncbi:MAG: hypothetical protein QOF61_1728 [Acidobacteriota bacterium]|jgi:hypothetical protein|nr:hypothetical protein [Acidobacteriota bacterium]
MDKFKAIGVCLLALLLSAVCVGQKNARATTGGVKGKVRVDSGATAEGVRVSLRRGDDEVAHAETGRNGEFQIAGIAPGTYTLMFRKTGLKTAELKPYEIKAGKINSLGDHVFMPVDEGSIAFVKGSVFTAAGRSVEGARVELSLVGADGSVKKIDGRLSNESGQFSFRLKPVAGHYRVTAKGEGGEATQDVDVEGAMVYRVALSLKPGQ